MKFDVFHLRMFAFVSMFVDHAAFLFLLPSSFFYVLCRSFGRVAFPLFFFLSLEGVYHTKNIRAYIFRLAVLAFVSQPFYTLFFQADNLNVVFQLLNCVFFAAFLRDFKGGVDWLYLPMFLPLSGFSDYGIYPLLFVALYVAYRRQKLDNIRFMIIWVLLCAAYTIDLFCSAAFSAVLIAFYTGDSGRNIHKWISYSFYPVHMILLMIVRCIL